MYGLEVDGHFWKNDLKSFSWMAPRDKLIDPTVALWLVLGSDEELLASNNLYGLSLLTIAVQAQRGYHFPIMILQTAGKLLVPEQLSTPLKEANVLVASDTGLGAKVVAKVHAASNPIPSEYHLDIYANEQIGQWFEIVPASSSWPGAMFGVSDAEIAFHAVGLKGQLPSKTVLNYPIQGMKLQMGEKEYLAWATQNELDPATSYFVKVDGYPESIIFGPYSTAEAADVFVVRLK
ncbi:MAG: hypothetical protein JRF34_08375 [Deltaproteobacteria bacterium]|nr:hypothetical protein [Deltaproteobacteria bacterium]